MHVDSLEHRKLFAATSSLKDGIVRVVGTDESEKIEVRHLAALTIADAGKTASDATRSVQVLVNGKELATYASADVKRVNVFGLGGRDTIIGPAGSEGRVVRVVNVGDGTAQPITTVASSPALRLYVEGGSGNDRISGGSGNDWLYGGRGNDSIVDGDGRNLIDGGAGDDTIDSNDSVTRVTFTRGRIGSGSVVWTGGTGGNIVINTATAGDQFIGSGGTTTVTDGSGKVIRVSTVPFTSPRSTPDTVIGGDGNDTAVVNGDDVVTTVEVKRTAFMPATTTESLVSGLKIPASFRVGSVIHSEAGTAVLNEGGTLVFFEGKLYDARGFRGKDGGNRFEDLLQLVKSGEGVSVEGEYSAGSIIVSEFGVAVISNDGTKLQYKGREYDASKLRGEDGGIQFGDILELVEGRSPTRGS